MITRRTNENNEIRLSLHFPPSSDLFPPQRQASPLSCVNSARTCERPVRPLLKGSLPSTCLTQRRAYFRVLRVLDFFLFSEGKCLFRSFSILISSFRVLALADSSLLQGHQRHRCTSASVAVSWLCQTGCAVVGVVHTLDRMSRCDFTGSHSRLGFFPLC